jgi:hypothetical protein
LAIGTWHLGVSDCASVFPVLLFKAKTKVPIARQDRLVSKIAVNFAQSLAAVLAGNAAYFLLMPVLPLSARHIPFQMDLGLVVDVCLCFVAWAIINAASGRR